MSYTKKWLKAATVRALRSTGETLAAALTAGVLISNLDWRVVGLTVAGSVILTYAIALGSLPEAKLPEPDYETEGDPDGKHVAKG